MLTLDEIKPHIFKDNSTTLEINKLLTHHEAFISLLRQTVLLFPKGITTVVAKASADNYIFASAVMSHYCAPLFFIKDPNEILEISADLSHTLFLDTEITDPVYMDLIKEKLTQKGGELRKTLSIKSSDFQQNVDTLF